MYRMLLLVVLLLVTLAAAYAALGPFPGLAGVLAADEYNPLGCVRIAGWDWLRATDARVTWVFDTTALHGADIDSVYLNVAPLITDTVDGGAGWEAQLRFWVSAGEGMAGYSTVPAVNPYRPQTSYNSRGVGYRCYGHGSPLSRELISRAMDTGRLTVTLVWTVDTVLPIRHVAVNRDAVTLGYADLETG